MEIKKLIGIIGPTCSGKSTITKMIHEILPVSVVSFGKYLFDFSTANNLSVDKPSLQNLGNSFIHKDHIDFLHKVLKHGQTKEDTILIEGIRHQSIFKALKDMSTVAYFIYVDANKQVRYLRYCQRNNLSPEIYPYTDFDLMERHEVESEILSLKPNCNSIIQNDYFETAVLKQQLEKVIQTISVK